MTVRPWGETSHETTGEALIIGSISVMSNSKFPVSAEKTFAPFLFAPTPRMADLSGFKNLQP